MINKVILIGNLGDNPVIRSFNNGGEVANFRLATSEKWKDKESGQVKEKVEWHNIAVYSQGLVNVIKNYVKKGSRLYIEGSLQTRKYIDKQGIEKYTTEVVLQSFNSAMKLLDTKQNSNNKENNQQPSNEEIDDDIPF